MLKIGPIHIPSSELEFRFGPSQGSGGQNVNKVSSRAFLRWNVSQSKALPADVKARFLKAFATKLSSEGDLIISSQESRNQGTNRARCLDKLQAMILKVAKAPKARVKTKIPQAIRKKRLDSKKRQSDKKRIRKNTNFD